MSTDLNANSSNTIAVTGATGFVGRYTVRALLSAGFHVRCLVRDVAKASNLLPTADERIGLSPGDILDESALDQLTKGAAAVVNAVGIRRETADARFEPVHVEGTKKLIAAAHNNGVDRIVHVSALGVRANAPTAYQQTKYRAEKLVRNSGPNWTIFRPSLIHGPDGELMKMIKDWALGRTQPHFFMPYFQRVDGAEGFPPLPVLSNTKIAPVAVEDVAGAIAQSLKTPDAIGEVYTLTGPDEMEWPDMLGAVRDRLPLVTSKKPIIGIPSHVGIAAAIGAKILGLAQALPFGTSEPILASQDNVGSAVKAKAHLGFDPKAFVPALDEYAAQV